MQSTFQLWNQRWIELLMIITHLIASFQFLIFELENRAFKSPYHGAGTRLNVPLIFKMRFNDIRHFSFGKNIHYQCKRSRMFCLTLRIFMNGENVDMILRWRSADEFPLNYSGHVVFTMRSMMKFSYDWRPMGNHVAQVLSTGALLKPVAPKWTKLHTRPIGGSISRRTSPRQVAR